VARAKTGVFTNKFIAGIPYIDPLVQQLDLVHRSMALMATSSLAVTGRGFPAQLQQDEHDLIVQMN